MRNKKCIKEGCGKELGRRQKMYCSNECKLTDPKGISKRTSKKEVQDSSKLLKCIHTNKTFKDLSNYSGILTRHLRELGIVTEDLFENFVVIENPDSNKSTYKCRYCSWTTIDTENKSGCITVHLKNHHDITPTDHIQKYPEESNIWSYTNSIELREYYLSKNEDSYLECLECGIKMKRITSTHLEKHGMTMDQYREKYGIKDLSSKDYMKFLKEHRRESFHPKGASFTSKGQSEIFEFLKSLDLDPELENRKLIYPTELDIVVESHKIAIEYNGLYWHSEVRGKKLKDYHINKTERCEDMGYRLIHIFEDEWVQKREIVESKIKAIFKKNTNSVYARKCTVKSISREEKALFLAKHHIQGDDVCSNQFGLFNGEELVAVMTFVLPRRALGVKNYEKGHMELSRFVSSNRVIGGFSKIIKYAIKELVLKKIFTYADRRWSSCINETVYSKAGFTFISYTKPNYWYIVNNRDRKHRFNYTKNTIVKKMGGNPNLTEVENMINMGYDRIWDCGSIKYELIISR